MFGPKRAGDVEKTLADVTKLKKILEIQKFVTFQKGLEQTVSWFSERA